MLTLVNLMNFQTLYLARISIALHGFEFVTIHICLCHFKAQEYVTDSDLWYNSQTDKIVYGYRNHHRLCTGVV